MPETAPALPNFTPLPSDPRLLTVEHMRLVFADKDANRRFVERLAARLAMQNQSATPGADVLAEGVRNAR